MQLHDIRQSTANGIIVYECLRKLRLSSVCNVMYCG